MYAFDRKILLSNKRELLNPSLFLLLFLFLNWSIIPCSGATTFTTTAASGSTTDSWTSTINWSCGGCGRYPGQTGTDDIVFINRDIRLTFATAKTFTVGAITVTDASFRVQANATLIAASIDFTSTAAASSPYEFSVSATPSGSPTVNILGNVTINRNTAASVYTRFRVGGSDTYVTNSIVSIGGNLIYNYLAESDEGNTEISVGNSITPNIDDKCQLNISGDVLLTYNAAGTVGGSGLSFEVGHISSVTMNNLVMKLEEGGTGAGSDVKLVTRDDLGAAVTINGNVSMIFNDVTTPSSGSDIQMKIGNASAAANTIIDIKGNLFMTSNFSGAGTYNCNVEVSGSSNVVIGGNLEFKMSTSGSSVENRITLLDNSIFDLKGSIIRPKEGSFDFTPSTSNSTIKFSGSVAQNFPERFGTPSSYVNVALENSSGIAFTIPTATMDISGLLTMNKGIVNSTVSNQVVFGSGATSLGGSKDSYITGPVIKKGGAASTSDITLPLGAGSKWAPLKLSSFSGANASTTISAEYKNSGYANKTTNDNFASVSKLEYWNVSVSGTVPTADITLYWKDACWSDIKNLSVSTDLLVARFNSATSKWDDLVSTVNIGSSDCSGAGVGAVSANVSSFGTFTFGSKGANPLPVTLTDFRAEVVEKKDVKISWTTESEISNDYFLVQRSSDGYSFFPVGQIPGAGTSSEVHSYQLTDRDATTGTNYYRLVQIDLDGVENTYSTIAIKVEPDNAFEVYPNPVKNTEPLMATSRDAEAGYFIRKIISGQGQDVTPYCELKYIAPNKVQINMDRVHPGVYLILFDSKSGQVSKKIFVN